MDRRQVMNLSILEIEALLETAETTRTRLEARIEQLETENADLKSKNELYRSNLLAEQQGTNDKLRQLQQSVDQIVKHNPFDPIYT